MSRFDSSFWVATPIAPIPALARLRDMVLERSEKRFPKWKFRIASDVVVEIQPKLTNKSLLAFDGRALLCADANLDALLKPHNRIDRPYWFINFRLFAVIADHWMFKPTHCRWKRGADPALIEYLRECVVEAFGTRFNKLQPDMMLGSHCLCCGKGLTDPVSQARFIGPECAGTGSTNLPFIFTAKEDHHAT